MSFAETFHAVHLLHWLKTDGMTALADWRATAVSKLPEQVMTGVTSFHAENVAQFKHS